MVDVATKSSLPPATCEKDAFVAPELIAPPLAGYTNNAFAEVLINVIRIPATAVGRATPAPLATVLTTLTIDAITVALPCAVPAAETAALTELIK